MGRQTANGIPDLRKDFDDFALLNDGLLYRKSYKIQVYWKYDVIGRKLTEKQGKETWTFPHIYEAKQSFKELVQDNLPGNWAIAEHYCDVGDEIWFCGQNPHSKLYPTYIMTVVEKREDEIFFSFTKDLRLIKLIKNRNVKVNNGAALRRPKGEENSGIDHILWKILSARQPVILRECVVQRVLGNKKSEKYKAVF